jgi:signal transduction histidine kinase
MTDKFRKPASQEVDPLEPSHTETPPESLDRLRREVAELRGSRRRLAVAADADRRSIERELHDDTQQHLIALAVNLQLARDLLETDPVAARALLDEMCRCVEQALDVTAKLAQRIYPPLLESVGLGAALRAAAASNGVRARITVRAVEGAPPEIAGAVYFCCHDVLERAGAGARVRIAVRAADGALVFEVVQEQPGSAVPPSAGALDRLGDRIEALGGRLSVESEPGSGIRVRGSLPLSG